MHQWLRQNATFLGMGHIRAELYDLGRYPGIVLAPDGDGLVVGEVYALNEATAPVTWQALDEYEGRQYRCEQVIVQREDGATVDAWVYALCHVPASAIRIPSGDYLAWRAKHAVT